MTDIVEELRRSGAPGSLMAKAADEIERLNGEIAMLHQIGDPAFGISQSYAAELARQVGELEAENERLRDRMDELEDALHKIVSWSEAYPLDIFPEPDFKKAHEVLKANGMTIDAISASAARFAVAGIGLIAESALGKKVVGPFGG